MWQNSRIVTRKETFRHVRMQTRLYACVRACTCLNLPLANRNLRKKIRKGIVLKVLNGLSIKLSVVDHPAHTLPSKWDTAECHPTLIHRKMIWGKNLRPSSQI
jgi:hypothetical protein